MLDFLLEFRDQVDKFDSMLLRIAYSLRHMRISGSIVHMRDMIISLSAINFIGINKYHLIFLTIMYMRSGYHEYFLGYFKNYMVFKDAYAENWSP